MKLSKNNLTAFIVFLLVATIFTTSASIEHNLTLFRQEKEVRDSLTLIKSELEGLIESRMLSSNGLIAFSKVKPNFTQEDFETFVSNIFYAPNQVLMNITYITDTIITHIYPYESMKAAIGEDLSKQPNQVEYLNYVKNTRKSTLTGPVDLVQGGQGIIVRIPVLKSYDKVDQIAIVFDYNKLIESSGIITHSQDHFTSLAIVNPQSNKKEILWNNFESEPKDSIVQDITFEDFTLQLISLPKNGWNGKTILFNLLIGIGTIFSLGASVAVSHVLSTNQKLRITNSEIKYLLEHDELTDLYNRRKFYTTLNACLSDKSSGFIALLDMDNFKNINDILGHTYGDKILNHIAKILHEESSNEVSIYRIGGDEFVFLCDGCKHSDFLDQRLARIIHSFMVNNEVDRVKNYLTSSIGVVNYPNDGQNVEDLLLKAEVAMYRAKKNGKNQVVHYSNDLMSDFEEKIAIESRLRDAVQNEDFMLLYQPIIKSRTGEVSYFEALIRFIERDQADVLEGLISLIHGLDLVVVAEGVELNEESQMLRQFECDFLQGYLFSKPVKGEQAQLLIGHQYKML